MIDKITPNENKSFFKQTPRQALMDALMNVDEFSMCVIVMGTTLPENGDGKFYHAGAGVDIVQTLGLLAIAQSHALTEE